jgi:hypothetical protein
VRPRGATRGQGTGGVEWARGTVRASRGAGGEGEIKKERGSGGREQRANGQSRRRARVRVLGIPRLRNASFGDRRQAEADRSGEGLRETGGRGED